MIQNVRSGQALTAALLNNIIAQANGQDIPFNENFFNTDKGTLYISKQDYEVRTDDASFYNFLECWIDNAPEITSRTEEDDTSGGSSKTMKPYILVNLGNEAETAKKNITVNNKPVDGIILISHNESLDAEVTDEILQKNLFVQLAEIDSSSENMYDVHFILFKAIRVTDDDNPPKILGYIFAISKEDVESAKDRAKSIIRKIQGFSGLTHLEVLNNKKILAASKITDNDILIQNVIGSQDLMDDNRLSSDTDVSNRGEKLNQYSVEIKSTVVEKEDATGEAIPTEVKYAQLYDFDDAVVSPGINKNDVKKYSILVR